MADHQTPGDKTVERIARRADMGLSKKEGPDGGEVYTGELARKALRAVGARAMTLDNTIVVDEGFDFGKSEDAALYAHERVHDEGSGGNDVNVGARDAEEITARAVERMVLHRTKAGESLGGIMREVKETGVAHLAADTSSSDSAGAPPATSGGTRPAEVDPARAALMALFAAGKSEEQIVKEMTRYVLQTLRSGEELAQFRLSPTRFAAR